MKIEINESVRVIKVHTEDNTESGALLRITKWLKRIWSKGHV